MSNNIEGRVDMVGLPTTAGFYGLRDSMLRAKA
jgi:hypothetical protein